MRDASCDYETYESKAGAAFSSIYEKCLLDKTNERIEYLKKYNWIVLGPHFRFG